MNFIHIIDVIFFIVLPIGVIAYAIKYAWEDVLPVFGRAAPTIICP
mgnify:CR=1 FL=1